MNAAMPDRSPPVPGAGRGTAGAGANAPMKILVTGISGQLGHDLVGALAPLGRVVGLDRRTLDLASPDSIRTALRRLAPDVIFNPAAWTAVDQAEAEPEAAMQANATGPGVLAEEAERLGAWLVHYSTDYVFDGNGTRPWREDDPTAPLGVYGRSKLAGEQAVAAACSRHLILRTSWVYSLRGRNFLATMHRLAGERDELRVVDDQIGAPTTSAALARAGMLIARRLRTGPPPAAGIYHASCAGRTSWCGFARAIVERLPAVARALGAPPPQRRPRVQPIRTEDFPTPAARPRWSVLDNGKLAREFGIALPDWQAALDRLLAPHGRSG